MTEKSKNVHQRLAAAMAEVDYIQKEKKQGMNYTIVSHDAVTAKVRPVLLKNGIVYYPVRCEHLHNGNRAECSLTVRFVNVDDPTDCFDVPTFGYGIDTQDKGPGKAMSYAVKYALLKALGLETGDDPDTESVEFVPEIKAKPAAPKPISSAENKRQLAQIDNELVDCRTPGDVTKLLNIWADEAEKAGWSSDYWNEARRRFARRKKELEDADDAVSAIQDQFPGATVTDERLHA